MSVAPAESDAAAPPERRFWPHFAVPAILTPVVWVVTQGSIGPNGIIEFYVVSIGSIPLAYVFVLLPGWRLLWAARTGKTSRWLIPLIALLMLPSLAILLWGVYTAVWLLILLITVDF